MKSITRSLLGIMLLASSGALVADCDSPVAVVPCQSECKLDLDCDTNNRCCDEHSYYNRTHFSLRPQGSNSARLLMGTAEKTHLFGKEDCYGVASVALEYSQTFNNDDLGKFFSPNCSNCIYFGQEGTLGVDVNALDFGLSPTFKGSITLNPTIKNFVIDLDFFFGLDEFMCGLWARVNAPLTYTRWEMCLNERASEVGGDTYDTNVSNLVTTDRTKNSVVYRKISNAWCGDKPFGDAPALRAGKLCCTKDDDFNVAGLRFDIGYDLWRRECGYFGVAATVNAGLGSRPTAEKLFQPVVGAQHAWQLGGNVSGAYRLWRGNENTSLTAYTDTTITHLFRARQKRLFGLKNNGAWSHYLLLKKFREDTPGTPVYDRLERAANILCHDVKVKTDVMIDSSAMLAYRSCSFGAGLGFGIWYRSAEKIEDACGINIQERTYGVKGDALAGDTNVDPKATIKDYGTDPLVDVATDATGFLTNEDFDPCTGLHPSALSGKLFGYMEYSWEDCEWAPYVLAGSEIEFGRGNTAVSQWGLILKAGVTY